MNRTFQSRTRWDQIIYLLLIAALCFYMVWVKQAIIATILAVLLIILVERIIHTEYIITDDKLIIKQGRFSKVKELNLDQINDIEDRTTTKFGSFYIARFVLITYNKNKYVSITPLNTERFLKAIIKKKEHYIN